MSNPLVEVRRLGQSIWYDNIRRGLIVSGELARMVEQDGLLGITSNPSIFEKAIAGSHDYDPATRALVRQGVDSAGEIFERLAVEDIQWAADVLHPVWVRTEGRDGYVSLEVSPHLAHDTEGTVSEALRLHAAVGRDNILIKIPGTAEGIPAIRRVIAAGVPVNVTLLFSVGVYERVAEAYMEGLEERVGRGEPLQQLASVASFFVSRIDTLVDEKLGQALDETRDAERRAKLKSLVGRVAIANARVAYERFHSIYASERWKALAEKGARKQRLLWASTSTKNPKYSKTLYVDELVAPETVNTVPTDTWLALKAAGKVPRPMTEKWEETAQEARRVMSTLNEVGIAMADVTEALTADGVKKFADAFDALLIAVDKKRHELRGAKGGGQRRHVGRENEAAIAAALETWQREGRTKRLWDGDASLWTNGGEGNWLGWLHAVRGQREHLGPLQRLAGEVKGEGFTHAVVLGMGGSSLCPDVLSRTFTPADGFPRLMVLDSTVPAQVRAVEEALDIQRTLFIVSSKSGTTSEPNAFLDYFMEHVRTTLGDGEAGRRFVAVTDPGTALHKRAKSEHFRAIFHGEPSIGGRYSALSNFGLVPAAVMGLDVAALLDRAEVMVEACAPSMPAPENPGVALGIAMGTMAARGRDKVTILPAPELAAFGAWLEQLIAESTGKHGKGIVPVDGERAAAPSIYGRDRLFVHARLVSSVPGDLDRAVDTLQRSGHPVLRIEIGDLLDLGAEFFRWEVATAVAGAVLELNPFDQPDVEASKVATRELTAAFEKDGELPQGKPFLEESGVRLYAGAEYAKKLADAAGGPAAALDAILAAHLAQLEPGDYFALNAYLAMDQANDRELQALRHAVRDKRHVATTLGYGPRFLHSTGQLHKGGPNRGVFLQITSDDGEDLAIPGKRYGFSIMKQAQALGDFQVLMERKRRALRVHLGADVAAELALLRERMMRILA
jgi:transaldolase/glucose-6-phosphate isomerase